MERKKGSNFKKAMDEMLGTSPAEAETSKKVMKEEVVIEEVKREEALVSSDMRIEGNIVTTSGMKILGDIIGDVLCGGNITLQGNIQGNVSARNLIIKKGSLTGDVSVQEKVSIYQEAIIKGNIKTKSIDTDGKIEGKIQADGEVELQKNAVVEGDIFAKCFSVVCGAKVKGTVNVHE